MKTEFKKSKMAWDSLLPMNLKSLSEIYRNYSSFLSCCLVLASQPLVSDEELTLFQLSELINRAGVAGAVLQTPPSLGKRSFVN